MNHSTNMLPSVKQCIAIASGKGGVGKSTTAVNIALAMQQQGYSIGLLDADIYGPSLPIMLGIDPDTRPEVKDEKYFIPIMAQGLQTMSIGNLVTDKTPMVWRGPMASGALVQILTQTLWHNLDFLFIDLPPGTGDIQLTLSQKVALDGAVIVTTPQTIALNDAVKGIEMFQKVSVPILGIVENMATFICPNCNSEHSIFGANGGAAVAEDYKVPLLGQIPLNSSIRQMMDEGTPAKLAETQSLKAVHQAYNHCASAIIEQLGCTHSPQPEIIIE